MKKTYIQPTTMIVELEAQTTLLDGSFNKPSATSIEADAEYEVL